VPRLTDRVALVTGGARGIGLSIAQRLVAEGATVVIADLDEATGTEAVTDLERLGGRAAFQSLDVVIENQWQRVVASTVSEFGGLDILVNNAGVSSDGAAIEEATQSDWDRVISINQTGVFLGLKCAAAALVHSSHGSVVNISSITGSSGGSGTSPAYYASKAAVRILTKNTAMHWAKRGVRVNSVDPGYIDTAMLRHSVSRSDDLLQAILATTPMGRLGSPEDVAAAVAFLASDDASFVTGIELYVDGGYMAR
jgi:NAD(P)-dependent dehydrogenase (short-subunit alcohol dehydrogenase family)